VLPNSVAVLPLLGQNLLSGKGAVLTHRAVASARTIAVHASARLLQVTITHARGAVTGLHAICLCAEHSDAPPSDQSGLPWCQPTYPVCHWQAILLTWAHPAHLPAFNAVVGLESREGPSTTARGRASPTPTTEAARGGTGPLPGGRVVWAPEAGRSGQARGGLAPTRGGLGPP
jgi:hypothetical protein